MTVHEGIGGNKTADQLAKLGSTQPVTGLDPACGIFMKVTKKAVKDWTNRAHRKHCNSFTGLRQAKALIQGPSANKTRAIKTEQK
jgi:hypothetical protein